MKKFILSALTLVLVSVATMAQNNNGGQRQRMNPAEMYSMQAERIAKQIKLDDSKAESFKVLYVDYQTARRNAARPKGEKEGEENVDFKKMTDAQANELIQQHFAAQEAQLAVDKAYLPKFLDILTPTQAAQIYLRGGFNQQGGFNRQGGMGGNRPGGMGGNRPGGMGGQRGGGQGFDGSSM